MTAKAGLLLVAAGLLLAGLLLGATANAECVLVQKADVALDVIGGAITLPLQVNSANATFILDTGAQRSVVTEAAVRRLGLARDQWVGTTIQGLGGTERRANADPRSLTLGGVPLVRRTLNHDTSLTVGILPRTQIGNLVIDGVLGRDFLAVFDLDLDMPGRRLVLYDVHGCAGRFLPWRDGYTALPVMFPAGNALVLSVTLDGTPLRALLDTGASTSLVAAPGLFRLGLNSAALAGDPADEVSGLGPHMLTMHRHRFRSLRVGSETIDTPVIWLGSVQLTPIVDMLLGADWLAARRVWMSFATRQVFSGTQ